MGILKISFKLFVSIIFDISDFFIGRIPVFGTVYDILGGFLGLWLWGIPGGLQFMEIIDLTDQIDGFLPTVTLAGIYCLLAHKED